MTNMLAQLSLHVSWDILEYVLSSAVLRHANGFCNDRSHSTRILLPLFLYGKLNLIIGIRAVSLTVSTSDMPSSINLTASFSIAATPLSLVKSVADCGICRQRSRSELGELRGQRVTSISRQCVGLKQISCSGAYPNPLAEEPNTATLVPSGNAPLAVTTCSMPDRTASLLI